MNDFERISEKIKYILNPRKKKLAYQVFSKFIISTLEKEGVFDYR